MQFHELPCMHRHFAIEKLVAFPFIYSLELFLQLLINNKLFIYVELETRAISASAFLQQVKERKNSNHSFVSCNSD